MSSLFSEFAVVSNAHEHYVDILETQHETNARSISRSGLRSLLKDLTRLIQNKPQFCYPFNSHKLKTLFTSSALSSEDGTPLVGQLLGSGERFHPAQKFPQHYSTQAPTVVVSYTWTLCLLTELPAFLDEFENLVGHPQDLTYWIDIFFNDQNCVDISKELEKAEHLYMTSKYHCVILAQGCLTRAWVNHEIALRLKALQDNLVEAEPIVVSVHGFTDDLEIAPEDAFDSMESSVPEDKIHIQRKILQHFHEKKIFNDLIFKFTSEARRRLMNVEIDLITRTVVAGCQSPIFFCFSLIHIKHQVLERSHEMRKVFGSKIIMRDADVDKRIALRLKTEKLSRRTHNFLLWVALASMVLFIFWCKEMKSTNNASFRSACPGYWEYNLSAFLLKFYVASRMLGLSANRALSLSSANLLCILLQTFTLADIVETSIAWNAPNCTAVASESYREDSAWGLPSFHLIVIGWIGVGLEFTSLFICVVRLWCSHLIWTHA